MINISNLKNNVDSVSAVIDENKNPAVPFQTTGIENTLLAGTQVSAYGRQAPFLNDYAGPRSEVDVRALSRPTYYGTYEWTPAAFSQEIKPWSLLTTNTLLSAYLATVSHVSLDAVVRVVMNGDPTVFGRLIMWYETDFIPVSDPTVGTSLASYQRLNLPHILMDPSKPNVYEFVVPMLCNNGVGTIDSDVATVDALFDITAAIQPVRVHIADAAGLASSSAATPNNVDFSVFVYYKNSRLFGAVTRTSLVEPMSNVIPAPAMAVNPNLPIVEAARVDEIPLLSDYPDLNDFEFDKPIPENTAKTARLLSKYLPGAAGFIAGLGAELLMEFLAGELIDMVFNAVFPPSYVLTLVSEFSNPDDLVFINGTRAYLFGQLADGEQLSAGKITSIAHAQAVIDWSATQPPLPDGVSYHYEVLDSDYAMLMVGFTHAMMVLDDVYVNAVTENMPSLVVAETPTDIEVLVIPMAPAPIEPVGVAPATPSAPPIVVVDAPSIPADDIPIEVPVQQSPPRAANPVPTAEPPSGGSSQDDVVASCSSHMRYKRKHRKTRMLGTCVPTSFMFNRGVDYVKGLVKARNDPGTTMNPFKNMDSTLKKKLSPYMTPSTVDRTLGYVGYMLGFSRRVEPTTTYGMDTSAEVAVVHTQVVSYHPHDELAVTGPTYGDVDEDPLSLASLCGRYGQLTQFSYTTADAVSTLLLVVPVTPVYIQYSPSENIGVANPLAHTSILYEYWRGSITYRVSAVSNMFCRGVLAIRHATTPDDYTDFSITTPFASTDPELHLDLSKSSVIEFTVPWKQPCALAPVSIFGPTFVGTKPAVLANPASINGLLYFEVVTPLHTPYEPNQISIFVEVMAGPDFTLYSPTMGNVSYAGLVLPDITPTSIVLGSGLATVNPAVFTTGSVELSTRPLLKIPQTFAITEQVVPALTNALSTYYAIRQPRQATEIDTTRAVTINSVALFQTFRSWVSSMFQFEKGGTLYTLQSAARPNASGVNLQNGFFENTVTAMRLPLSWSAGSDGVSDIDIKTLSIASTTGGDEFARHFTPATTLVIGPIGNGPSVIGNANDELASFVLTDISPSLMRTVARAVKPAAMTGDAQYAIVTIRNPAYFTSSNIEMRLYHSSCGADDYTLLHYYAPPVWQVRDVGMRTIWGYVAP